MALCGSCVSNCRLCDEKNILGNSKFYDNSLRQFQDTNFSPNLNIDKHFYLNTYISDKTWSEKSSKLIPTLRSL
jgi:hypothetical protein